MFFFSRGFDVFLNLLINSDGEFNADGLDRFAKEVKPTECGLSYAVVAIMGPQSSGKSLKLCSIWLIFEVFGEFGFGAYGF